MKLIEKCDDLDARDSDDWYNNALHKAAVKGLAPVVEALIAKSPAANAVNVKDKL